MISIDYETFLISDDSIFPKPVCLSGYDGEQTFLFKNGREFLSKHLNKELIVAHNAVFECGVTITHYPELANQVFDALDNGLIYCTKINEELWDIQRQKSIGSKTLAALVLHYYGVDISATKGEDAWRLRYSELYDVPLENWPKEATDYAIDDSIWAYKLKNKQADINQKLALKSAVYLNLMGAEGFLIDSERVEKLEFEINEFLTPRYEFLVSEGFCYYLKDKPKKRMKEFKAYIDNLDIVTQKTEKGSTSTTTEHLMTYLSQTDDPVIRAFSELSKYEKMLNTYVKNLKKAKPKIYTQYSTVKKSGRTSSSSSKLFASVNIQNQPREVPDVTYDIRNCYVPRPGFKIVSIDYGALELCAVAHQLYNFLGYSKMRELLNSGYRPVDLHSHLAARKKGVTYEEFIKNKDKVFRDKMKAVGLGLPGGMGYDTIRHDMLKKGIKTDYEVLGTSPSKQELYSVLLEYPGQNLRVKQIAKREYALVKDEIVSLKRGVFDAYPELEEFLKEGHKKFQTGKFKWTKNDFGEWEQDEMHRYTTHNVTRDWCTYTSLCNGFMMQTPSASGAQQAVCKLFREFYDNPNIFLQAFIHDEVVFEIREEAYELSERAANIMTESMQIALPSVRITVEENWMEYWQKADGFKTGTYWKNIK